MIYGRDANPKGDWDSLGSLEKLRQDVFGQWRSKLRSRDQCRSGNGHNLVTTGDAGLFMDANDLPRYRFRFIY